MICPRCGKEMETRTHKEITPRQLKGEYYFSQWDSCPYCRYIKLYEKYKVYNSPEVSFINQRLFEENKLKNGNVEKQEGLFEDNNQKATELKEFLKTFYIDKST